MKSFRLDSHERMIDRFERRLHKSDISWPDVITLHLTDRCNHNCPWCFFNRVARDAEMQQVINVTSYLIARGASEVVVSGGGEPLLHPEISLLLGTLEAHPSIHRRLYTNGSAIGRHRTRIASAFDYVRVSLDAGTPELYAKLHGCSQGMFNRILSELETLMTLNPVMTVGVSAVVSHENAATMGDLVRECCDRGIRQVFMKPVMIANERKFPEGFLSTLAASIDADIRLPTPPTKEPRIPSSMASVNLVLCADNGIYPCCHLAGEAQRISRVDVEELKKAYGSDRHYSILSAYAAAPHPCRAHDLWTSLIQQEKDASIKLLENV